MKSMGLIEIYEKQFSLRDAQKLGPGGKEINVQLTDYGKKEVIGAPDQEGQYRVKLGEMKLSKIIKTEPSASGWKNEYDYVLIYGTYYYIDTDICKKYYELEGINLSGEYKFKTVLSCEKLFGKEFKYSYYFDWGRLDKDGWDSNMIPNNAIKIDPSVESKKQEIIVISKMDINTVKNDATKNDALKNDKNIVKDDSSVKIEQQSIASSKDTKQIIKNEPEGFREIKWGEVINKNIYTNMKCKSLNQGTSKSFDICENIKDNFNDYREYKK